MISKIKTICLFIAIVFFNNLLANNLDEAWKAFNKNDRLTARKYFLLATDEPETAADAWLGLAYLTNFELDARGARNQFFKFYKLAKRMQPQERDAYLYACWINELFADGYGRIKDKKQLSAFREIAENSDTNGSLQAMAHYMIARHYQAVGDFSKAAKYFKKIGSIQAWSLTGAFDNTSGSGFDKDYGPLEHPQQDEVFINKYKAEVSWYEVIRNQLGDWVDLSYYIDNDDGVSYLQTFITSPEEREVYLGLGPSGSMKVWVNDREVYADEEEYAMDMDAVVVRVKLHKGGNRLLIQLGESDRSQADVLARVMDENFHVIPDLTYNAFYIPYEKEASYKSEVIPHFAETVFKKKIEAEPDNLLNYILLADVYLHNRKIKQGLEVIGKARNLAPDNSFLMFKQILFLSKDNNRTELTKLVEWMKTNDKRSPVSIVLQIEEANSNKDYDKVEELIGALKEELNGTNSETIYEYTVKLLSAREKYEELIVLAKIAYSAYPTNPTFVNINYLIEKNAYKNPTGAIGILRKYLFKNYDPSTILSLTEDYMDIGQHQKAINILEKLIANYPNRIGYYTKLSDFFYNKSRYDRARKWMNKVMEQVPYNGYFHKKTGLIMEQWGKKQEALELLRKALYYDPNQFDVREKIRELLGQPDVFDYFNSEDAYQLFANAPEAKNYPDDNSLILLEEKQRVVYKEGVSESKVNLLVKIFNNSGIEDWKEYQINAHPYYQHLIIEKAEVIKADGNKVPAETNGNNVIFTGLEPGDGIHLSYKIQETEYGKLLGYFSDKFYFESYIPSKLSRYQMLTPPDFEFKYKMAAKPIEPTKQLVEKDNWMLYTWEAKDQASIKYENNMPVLGDVAAILHISNFPSWDFVANWYSDIVTSQLRSDYETDAVIEKLFPDGYKGLSDEVKAQRIYEYIANNIAYSSISFRQSAYVPQKPSKTIRTRLGDCKDMSSLFLVLGRKVGLNSQLVLVDTRDNGQKDMLLPSVAFNHCIIKLKEKDKEHFLELTNKFHPFIASDPYLEGALALEIPEKASEGLSAKLKKLDMNDERPILVERHTQVQMEGDDMLVETKTIKTNAAATGIRYSYKEQSVKNQEKNMLEAISNDFDNPVELLALSFDNLDENTADTVSYTFKFKVKKPTIKVNKITLVKFPWADGLHSLSFIADKTREYDYETWNFYLGYRTEDAYMAFVLPEGAKVLDLPENISTSYGGFHYKMEFKQEGQKVIAHRRLEFVPMSISPEEYPDFKKFFEKVLEGDNYYLSYE